MPICTVLTESEWRDRPRPLDSRRPVPPAFEEVDLGRRPGREDPRPERRAASTRALGSKKTWRLPGSRQEGPRVARCTVERRMRALGLTGAGPGRTVRTTRPAKGNPVPARPAPAATPAAARCGPALGGRLHLRADPARGSSLHRLRHGACARRPHRRLGHQHAHGAPGCGRRPGTGDPGRESTATAVIPGAWSTTATTDPSHLSIAYTGRLVDEGTGRLGRSRGLLPAQAPPPNTATIETTPPRHPPQHNQPPTKPRTIL